MHSPAQRSRSPTPSSPASVTDGGTPGHAVSPRGIAPHFEAWANDLRTYGAAVVPVFYEDERAAWEARLFEAMDEFPEYKARGRNAQRVLGGFGALGNPSSFHHPAVRHFRAVTKRGVFAPLFGKFAGEADMNLEMLFDRLCVRCEDFLRPSEEAWHRDIYDGAKYKLRPLPAGDLLFGGWTNLDHRDQKFVGLLGTHAETFATQQGGFAVFSDADIKRHRFRERLLSQAGTSFGATLYCDAEDGCVLVPPGHALVFFQKLVHSVRSGPQPDTPALRVFHGLRLTREATPLFDLERVLANGAVPRIPSGQLPPMYSQNHYAAFASRKESRWRTWGARTFQPACLYRRTLKDGTAYHTPGSKDDRNPAANKGRYMPSLAEMGLMAPAFQYGGADVAVLAPERL